MGGQEEGEGEEGGGKDEGEQEEEGGGKRGRGKSLFLQLRITSWNYNGRVINTCKNI